MSKKIKIGDIIKIPFKEGVHTYGRLLADGSYGIYDYPTNEDIKNLHQVIEAEFLFIARVNIFAIKDGNWAVVGNIPLEDKLKDYQPLYLNVTAMDGKYYNTYKNEIEEGIQKDWVKTKMQMAGSHSHFHIEQRIKDYYNGKRYGPNTQEVILFKMMANLPLGELESEKSRLFSSWNQPDKKPEYKPESFDQIKKDYPFDRWQSRFDDGFEQYSPANCDKAKAIADELIDRLSGLNEKSTEKQKIALFKNAVEAYNKLNDKNDGILIETEEREDLCVLINKITVATGLDPNQYGGGEGLAREWRDW